MKVEDMSDKAKEKHAEFLLKFSSNLFTAFFCYGCYESTECNFKSDSGSRHSAFLKSRKLTQALAGWQGITFLVFESLAFLFINHGTEYRKPSLMNGSEHARYA